jgi:hypothetical protein
MPGEEEARGVTRGEPQGGKRNRAPDGIEAGAVMEGDRVPLAEEWLPKNAGEGGFRNPSAIEGDMRLLEDESPTLFSFDREVTGLLHDQNRLQEASMMGEVTEVGTALWVVGEEIGSN